MFHGDRVSLRLRYASALRALRYARATLRLSRRSWHQGPAKAHATTNHALHLLRPMTPCTRRLRSTGASHAQAALHVRYTCAGYAPHPARCAASRLSRALRYARCVALRALRVACRVIGWRRRRRGRDRRRGRTGDVRIINDARARRCARTGACHDMPGQVRATTGDRQATKQTGDVYMMNM